MGNLPTQRMSFYALFIDKWLQFLNKIKYRFCSSIFFIQQLITSNCKSSTSICIGIAAI